MPWHKSQTVIWSPALRYAEHPLTLDASLLMVTRVFFWSMLNRLVKLKTQNRVIILVQEASSRFSNYLCPARMVPLEPSTIAQLAL
jgi:hypothetical protein